MEPRTIIAPRAEETWLVVDDFSSVRRMLGYWLRRAGLSAHGAADGGEAWELLQERPWAGVLTDCVMPRLDGIGLIRRLRAVPHLASLPVIMISAENAPDLRRRAFGAGADAVLAKPCTAQRLLAAIRQLEGSKV